MSYSNTTPFPKSFLSFYIARLCPHFAVFFALILHQLFIVSFIDVDLSAFVYFLCFCIFTIDGLFLYFYRENSPAREKHLLSVFLLFIDALFLSALLIVMELPFSLFFVFVLLALQSALLPLSRNLYYSLVFFLYLSILFPLSLLWAGKFSFEDRLALIIFTNVFLAVLFVFHWIINSIFRFFEKEVSFPVVEEDVSSIMTNFRDSDYLSLGLFRKLKPGLNSLMKYFPENTKIENKNLEVSQGFFPFDKGRQQLEQIRKFLSGFIEYAELETESFQMEVIDLNKLIDKTLAHLKTHPYRPEKLVETVRLPEAVKVKGSADHLKKCFEHILLNSFEALKNQSQPELYLQGWLKKRLLILEFSDNGHGIKPDDMKRLFDPLFSQRFGLRGLGLPYVRKMAQIHKAELDIQSSEEGTRVTMIFPLNDDFYDSSIKREKKRKKTA